MGLHPRLAQRQGKPGPQGDVGPQGPIGPGANQFGTNPNSVAAGRIYDCVAGELKLFADIVGEGIPAEEQLLHIAENMPNSFILGILSIYLIV